MSRLLLLGLVLFSACGVPPASFVGTYVGIFSVKGTCSDGRALDESYDAGWSVFQQGDRLTIATNGGCSPWTATVAGDVAYVDSKDCGLIQDDDDSFWPTLAEATITLKEGVLDVVGGFHDKSTTPELDGGTCDCTTVLSSMLMKQQP